MCVVCNGRGRLYSQEGAVTTIRPCEFCDPADRERRKLDARERLQKLKAEAEKKIREFERVEATN